MSCFLSAARFVVVFAAGGLVGDVAAVAIVVVVVVVVVVVIVVGVGVIAAFGASAISITVVVVVVAVVVVIVLAAEYVQMLKMLLVLVLFLSWVCYRCCEAAFSFEVAKAPGHFSNLVETYCNKNVMLRPCVGRKSLFLSSLL